MALYPNTRYVLRLFVLFVVWHPPRSGKSSYVLGHGCPCSSSSNISHFPIHQLKGRLAFLQSGKVTLIGCLNDSLSISQDRQYIIRTESMKHADVISFLLRYSTFVRYIPHDTILATLGGKAMKRALAQSSITGIYTVSNKLKLSPALISHSSWSEHPPTCENARLFLLFVRDADAVVGAELAEFCVNSTTGETLCNIALPLSGRKAVVETDNCKKHLAAERLAEHPLVYWVEERGVIRLRNKYATMLVQSTSGLERPVWANGLTGEGEVPKKMRARP